MVNSRKHNGSSLVLILIVMSILMILGTSMLTLAVSSYKFRFLEQNKKTNLYASEAGLDEAYEKMGTFVNEAIQQGNKAVEEYDKNFENLIKVERYRLEHEESKKSEYISENGLIDQSVVNEDRKTVFKYGYTASEKLSFEIGYMEGEERKDVECYDKDANNLDSEYRIEKGYTQFVKENINTDCISKINAQGDSNKSIQAQIVDSNYENYPIKISVNSKYTKNSIPRQIESIYEIQLAEHNVQYSLPTEIVKIPKNPAWSKALMVNGDMTINEGKLNIKNGDIYVNGTGISNNSGINLTNKDSKLSSKGNIITNKNLVLSYNQENTEQNVDVGGNVFCRNLLINETAEGAKLNISKSLYTLDDLEINAPNSHIDIEDSYYGVSDGSEGERNNPDNSSSIIINTEDIGNRVDENDNALGNNSTLSISKNLFIAGTSYIDLSDNIKYQTGESISIKGNYRAYTEAISNPTSKFKEGNVIFDYLDPLTLVTKYNKSIVDSDGLVQAIIENKRYISVYLTTKGQLAYNNATKFSILYNGKESKKLNIAKQGQSIYNEKIDTLKLYNKEDIENITVLLYDATSPSNKIATIENVALISNTELNAFDKSEYFKEYYNQFTKDSGLNLGEGISIDNNAQIIHSGSIFNTENKDNPISEGSWDGDKDNEIKAKSIQLKNELFYMGRMADYEDLTNSISIDKLTGANMLDNEKFYEIDLETQPVANIDTNVKFDKLTFTEKASNGELILLDKDANDYLIKGGITDDEFNSIKDKNLNAKTIDVSKDTSTSGLIIAKGNVIIAGGINFTGTIICGGNLTFEGTGDKNITYDKAYLENLAINNHELFRVAFADVGKYAQNDVNNYLFAKVYDNVNSSGNSESNKQLVRRTKWKLVR